MRKGVSRWGKRHTKEPPPVAIAVESGDKERNRPHARGHHADSSTRQRGGFQGASMKGNFPYSSFYDKLNARDRCDDLVLLEEVSIVGIVEVRIK